MRRLGPRMLPRINFFSRPPEWGKGRVRGVVAAEVAPGKTSAAGRRRPYPPAPAGGGGGERGGSEGGYFQQILLSGHGSVKTKRADEDVGTHPLMPAAPQALWVELMQFYIREAWLLDERKLTEWLDLFTDDVLYFMPRRKNVPRREAHRELTPQGDLAILEEDKRYLEMRVARLETGMAWAEDPRRAPVT